MAGALLSSGGTNIIWYTITNADSFYLANQNKWQPKEEGKILPFEG